MKKGLESKVNKRECWEIAEMAELICSELGNTEVEIDEIGQTYNEQKSYKTRTFDIYYDSVVEIIYKGQLVFRDGGKRTHRRSGSWEESFERLYSTCINKGYKELRQDNVI